MTALRNLRHSFALELFRVSDPSRYEPLLLASDFTLQGVYRSRGTSAFILQTGLSGTVLIVLSVVYVLYPLWAFVQAEPMYGLVVCPGGVDAVCQPHHTRDPLDGSGGRPSAWGCGHH